MVDVCASGFWFTLCPFYQLTFIIMSACELTEYLQNIYLVSRCVCSGSHVFLREKSTENSYTCLVLLYFVPYNTL